MPGTLNARQLERAWGLIEGLFPQVRQSERKRRALLRHFRSVCEPVPLVSRKRRWRKASFIEFVLHISGEMSAGLENFDLPFHLPSISLKLLPEGTWREEQIKKRKGSKPDSRVPSAQFHELPALLSIRIAAKLIGCSRGHIRTLIHSGHLEAWQCPKQLPPNKYNLAAYGSFFPLSGASLDSRKVFVKKCSLAAFLHFSFHASQMFFDTQAQEQLTKSEVVRWTGLTDYELERIVPLGLITHSKNSYSKSEIAWLFGLDQPLRPTQILYGCDHLVANKHGAGLIVKTWAQLHATSKDFSARDAECVSQLYNAAQRFDDIQARCRQRYKNRFV